eukprot:scaffold40665_cov31-Tisochrysis_lutea.AAC.4
MGVAREGWRYTARCVVRDACLAPGVHTAAEEEHVLNTSVCEGPGEPRGDNRLGGTLLERLSVHYCGACHALWPACQAPPRGRGLSAPCRRAQHPECGPRACSRRGMPRGAAVGRPSPSTRSAPVERAERGGMDSKRTTWHWASGASGGGRGPPSWWWAATGGAGRMYVATLDAERRKPRGREGEGWGEERAAWWPRPRSREVSRA